jgi:hypothetical protein
MILAIWLRFRPCGAANPQASRHDFVKGGSIAENGQGE